ncbi:hypothetical protein IscW_ISCW010354, partial [Ixodes scapularis]
GDIVDSPDTSSFWSHAGDFPRIYRGRLRLGGRAGALIWTLGKEVGEKSGCIDWPAPRSSVALTDHGRQFSRQRFRHVSRLGPQDSLAAAARRLLACLDRHNPNQPDDAVDSQPDDNDSRREPCGVPSGPPSCTSSPQATTTTPSRLGQDGTHFRVSNTSRPSSTQRVYPYPF